MIRHHPDINLLLEYSAGSIDSAVALSVSAHLHYCESCSEQVNRFNQLGGILLEELEHTSYQPENVNLRATPAMLRPLDQLFDSVMARVDNIENPATVSEGQASEIPIAVASKIRRDLPANLAKLIVKPRFLKWRRVAPAMQIAHLKTGQHRCEVSLIKIGAGGRVLEHNHKGNEYTVVLRGAFSDQDGIYSAGDFLHRKPGDVHTPNATADADCLCLAVVDAPLKFTGLLGWLINPFVQLQPG